MKTQTPLLRHTLSALAFGCVFSALAQTPADQPQRDPARPPIGEGPGLNGPPPSGPGGFGPGGRGPGGPGGFGGVQQETKLVNQFDKDGNQRLNAQERKAAREFLQTERAAGRGQRGPGGPRGGFGPGERGGNQEPPQPGPKLLPADVKSFPGVPLYDMTTLRTLFLEFENADWEKELADFNNTDVEVPAKLTVDGKTYPDVGVHFRGMSSFMMVGEGRKRSLNLSLDFVHSDQQLGGYHTLNLLNAHEDPTFLRAVLYYQIAREYLPAPKANFVHVVINGESWGVYASAQQFNKDFVKDWFGTTKGARWKVPGSPGGRGGLTYLGDDVREYKRIYDIKTKDDAKSWSDLIKLCQVLNDTPAEQLEKALAPLLDVDGALKFLALENVLINNDGYWIRASDYSIYQDEKGRFHVFPSDANETFLMPGGPGFGGGRRGFGGGPGFDRGTNVVGEGFGPGRGGFEPGRGPGGEGDFAGPPNRGGGPGFGGGPRINGVELDPLIGLSDANKPLRSKLLAVPALRARYLGYVRDIAEKWLDWNKLAPIAQQYHTLIADTVKTDTRKLDSTEAFMKGLTEDTQAEGGPGGPGGRRPTISLKSFAEKRRAYLLSHSEVKQAELPAGASRKN